MHSFYLDAIRKFEGFTPQATWDYAQLSNGYGTRARYAGEVIDRAEAERRFRAEISEARSVVEKAVPHVDEGTKAALTSLTYNAGTAWIDSGLGEAVRRGDLDDAREIFQKYNKAGGEVLPGLVSRRSQEALWIGNPEAVLATAGAPDAGGVGPGGRTVRPPAGLDGDQSAMRVAEMLRARPASTAGAADRSDAGPFARGPRTERLAAAGPLAGVAGEALMALVETDRLASVHTADVARLAQLGRGSELASSRSDRDRQESETRRV